MNKKIDARGLACPQPVIMAKKALDEFGDAVIIVDNKTSVENVTRMGQSRGCEVKVDEAGGGVWEIFLSGIRGRFHRFSRRTIGISRFR